MYKILDKKIMNREGNSRESITKQIHTMRVKALDQS